MSFSMPSHTLTREDIISYDDFMAIRESKQKEIINIKKHRRIPLGPEATLYFENKLTLWWQIQEMLRIEKGGENQIADELYAYAPLVPRIFENGDKELVATFMIEINDLIRRREMLMKLGGIENLLTIRSGLFSIKGIPEDDIERTTPDGKTSSVHFIRFKIPQEAWLTFQQEKSDIIIEVNHSDYAHKTLLSEESRKSLFQNE